ncbi:MAG: molybdopterin-dependent oxidoreductase [Steroidobacteraceae bacterium]|jgi:isoquinoline 1-oxidoreductase beta subunit|nr:molybdopterin-dependent oxidoreductase [Steroidobacteraceae bacterium]
MTRLIADAPASAGPNDSRLLTRRELLGWSGGAVLAAGAWPAASRAAGVTGASSAATPALGAAGEPATAELVAAYVRVEADGTVVIVTPDAELGQGTSASLPAIVADEMGADWARVRVELSGAGEIWSNPMKKMQATSRSMSVRGYWDVLRRVGAACRELLVAAAAERWGCPVAECSATGGRVVHAGTGRTLDFGVLAARAAELPVPAAPRLRPESDFRLIGRAIPRHDVPAKVTGRAEYGIDVRLPGLLTATLAHAPARDSTLVRHDAAAARAVRGVVGVVVTDAGLAPALVVVAEHYWAARQGLVAAAPEWTPTRAGLDEAVLARDRRATLDARRQPAHAVGDAPAALASAARRIAVEYDVPYLAHATMEPPTCTVRIDGDRVEIWTAAQGPVRVRDAVAARLGIPRERVTVIRPYAGGGFGRRWFVDFVLQAVDVAKQVGRPVKLVWSREEDLRQDYYRPAVTARMQGALHADGTLAALAIDVAGASILKYGQPPRPDAPLDRSLVSGLADLPYAIPHLSVGAAETATPVPVGMWRSVGHSQNGYFVECLLDELAQAARVDPLRFRLQLLAERPRHRAVLEACARRAGWGTRSPKGVGRGIALCESYAAVVAQVVEVEVRSRRLSIRRIVCAADVGPPVCPSGVHAQLEGAIVYGLSAALWGEVPLEDGVPALRNFDGYRLLRLREMPRVDVELVDTGAPLGGAGEPGLPPIAPALVNAIAAATGVRVRRLPIAREGWTLA